MSTFSRVCSCNMFQSKLSFALSYRVVGDHKTQGKEWDGGAGGAPAHSKHLQKVSGSPWMFSPWLPSQPGLEARGWATLCHANGKPFLSADSHMSGSICPLPLHCEQQHIRGILLMPQYLVLHNTERCNPEGCRMKALWGKRPPMTMSKGGVCQTNVLYSLPPMDQLIRSILSLPTNAPTRDTSCLPS